jgi:hypothetical protein
MEKNLAVMDRFRCSERDHNGISCWCAWLGPLDDHLIFKTAALMDAESGVVFARSLTAPAVLLRQDDRNYLSQLHGDTPEAVEKNSFGSLDVFGEYYIFLRGRKENIFDNRRLDRDQGQQWSAETHAQFPKSTQLQVETILSLEIFQQLPSDLLKTFLIPKYICGPVPIYKSTFIFKSGLKTAFVVRTQKLIVIVGTEGVPGPVIENLEKITNFLALSGF